jgi:hypothetical protein
MIRTSTQKTEKDIHVHDTWDPDSAGKLQGIREQLLCNNLDSMLHVLYYYYHCLITL